MASEETLAARWQAADPGADEEITRRFYTGVLRFFELKYPSEAEDLAQQMFLAALEDLASSPRRVGRPTRAARCSCIGERNFRSTRL